MRRRFRIITGIFFTLLFAAGIAFPTAEYDGLQNRILYPEDARLLPVPKDNMNYFFLQSIENNTIIVIGDFTGVNKMIVYILDKGGDNTIDLVIDYYPASKKAYNRKDKSDSRFFTNDIAQLKKDIISGKIYRNNYCDYMYSYGELETIVKNWDTGAIAGDIYGFQAQFREVDEKEKVAGYFAYGKKAGGYYMQFRTIYYRTQAITEQKPILTYSVYCKDTNDLVVKETVDNLFKYKEPSAVRAEKEMEKETPK